MLEIKWHCYNPECLEYLCAIYCICVSVCLSVSKKLIEKTDQLTLAFVCFEEKARASKIMAKVKRKKFL